MSRKMARVASAAELLTAAIGATDPEARSILMGHARRQDLAERLAACTACDLRRTCRAAVPGELTSSSVAIIGEAPGADEDAAGRPVVGRAGKLLDDCLRLANLDRSKVAIINTVACRPPGNNFDEAVKADAPARCRAWLEEQIKLSGAWLLVPVGTVATRALLPEAHQGITELRGSLKWTDTHLVMPTFHPAYALRNPRAKSQIISDLQAVRRVVL